MSHNGFPNSQSNQQKRRDDADVNTDLFNPGDLVAARRSIHGHTNMAPTMNPELITANDSEKSFSQRNET